MKKNFLYRGLSILLTLCFLVVIFSACSSSSGELTPEESQETLDALLTKIRVTEVAARMDIDGGDISNPGEELPEIETYPFSVEGTAPLNVEIFASTEKAGANMDGWINEVAANFNEENLELEGQRVSVSIRPVASGLATDYIITGRYIPDAFSPANELWAEMLRANNVKVDMIEKRVAGNTAGILMKKQTYDTFVSNYQDVTLPNILDAVMNGDMLLGYTNPYVSSTGLNILTAMLQSFDPNDPLSSEAVAALEAFQAKVPPVAYTTAQMRESAKNGLVDAMVMEYQAYINEPTLKDFVFTPFGVRHDNPVYALDDLDPVKQEALKMFTDYCLEEASQTAAQRYGFNANDAYPGEEANFTGAQLFTAQQVWKEKKDSGRPVVAVFVTDVSGSMEGTPITELKSSLLNASKYINEGNYIGLVSYNRDVFINLPIGEFTPEHRAYFTGAVKDLSAAGNTATYDAVLVGLDMLLKAQAEIPNAKLMMFVLSDGIQNEGYDLDKIVPVVQGLGIPVHTIGYNADLEELQKLSTINEASSVNASENDVVYNLRNIFNAQM